MITLDSKIKISKCNAGLARWEMVKQVKAGNFPEVNAKKVLQAPTVEDTFLWFGIDIFGIQKDDGSYEGPIFLTNDDEEPELVERKLSCIAPFVESNSYLEAVIYGVYSRYLFFDKKLIVQIPETIKWKNLIPKTKD